MTKHPEILMNIRRSYERSAEIIKMAASGAITVITFLSLLPNHTTLAVNFEVVTDRNYMPQYSNE
jgi:hypothetical protein